MGQLKVTATFKSYEKYVAKLTWLYKHHYNAEAWTSKGLFYITYWK